MTVFARQPIEVAAHGTSSQVCRIQHTGGDISIGAKDATKNVTFTGGAELYLKVSDDVYFDDSATNPTLAGTIDRIQALQFAMNENGWDAAGNTWETVKDAVETSRASAATSLASCYSDLAAIYARIDALKTKISTIQNGIVCASPAEVTINNVNYMRYDVPLWDGAANSGAGQWSCANDDVPVPV
jgi:hypothetical protein